MIALVFALTISWLGLFAGFFLLRISKEEYPELQPLLNYLSTIILVIIAFITFVRLWVLSFYIELAMCIVVGILMYHKGLTILDSYILFIITSLATKANTNLLFLTLSLIFLYGITKGALASNVPKTKIVATLRSLSMQTIWFVVLVSILVSL